MALSRVSVVEVLSALSPELAASSLVALTPVQSAEVLKAMPGGVAGLTVALTLIVSKTSNPCLGRIASLSLSQI